MSRCARRRRRRSGTAVRGTPRVVPSCAPAAPAYIEFRVGDDADEIGFIDRRYAPPGSGQPNGAVMHWHVDDLEGTLARLLGLGAALYQPITEHGDGSGFVTASVVDPFGNVLGIMHNPHYLEIVAARGAGRAPAEVAG